MKIVISKWQIVLLILTGAFVAFLIYIKLFPDTDININSKTDPQNYVELFKDSVRADLELDNTVISKMRNPIVEFIYAKQYRIQVFKIDSMNKPMNPHLQKGPDIETFGKFFEISSGNCHIYYRYGHHKIISMKSIFNGDGFKVETQNKDALCVYFKNLNKFLVGYNNTNDAYIFGNTEDIHNYPKGIANNTCELLFLRRNGFLYFVFISPQVKNISVTPGLLKKLIKMPEANKPNL